MVAALAYNQWFTKLCCKDLRLVGTRRGGRSGREQCPLWFPIAAPLCPQGSEVLEQVLHTLSKSGSLEELVLDNAGLKT